jgi:uncharacterized membrane protein YkvI
MIRVVLTIVLPVLLPTLLYVLWLVTLGRAELAGHAVPWQRLPWTWLAVAGVGLAALMLVALSVGFGGREEGSYVPPHIEGGRIVPGHIEPAAPGQR